MINRNTKTPKRYKMNVLQSVCNSNKKNNKLQRQQQRHCMIFRVIMKPKADNNNSCWRKLTFKKTAKRLCTIRIGDFKQRRSWREEREKWQAGVRGRYSDHLPIFVLFCICFFVHTPIFRTVVGKSPQICKSNTNPAPFDL